MSQSILARIVESCAVNCLRVLASVLKIFCFRLDGLIDQEIFKNKNFNG